MNKALYIPCTWCSTPTPMTGTKFCDACWEANKGLSIIPTRVLAEELHDRTEAEHYVKLWNESGNI